MGAVPRSLAARLAAVALGSLMLASCGGSGGVTVQDLEAQPILEFPVAGASNVRKAGTEGGSRPAVTVLADVGGDWGAVSVRLARAVLRDGWTITSINCVGTGNDVIAKKRIGETWVLLESGAGTAGAGIILRYDPQQATPSALTVSGVCPPDLVAAAEGRSP
jgi:hypothetical protein